MALVTVEIDEDVRDMAVRIAGRIGKGLSATLQDGLIELAEAHGWSTSVHAADEPLEGKREEIYVLWATARPALRAQMLDLLASPEDAELRGTLEALQEDVQNKQARILELEALLGEVRAAAARERPTYPLRADEWVLNIAPLEHEIESPEVWILAAHPDPYGKLTLVTARRRYRPPENPDDPSF